MQNPEILVPSPDELIELDVFINYRTHASLWERGSDSSEYVLRVSADIGGCADLSPDGPESIEFKLGELLFYIIRVGNAIDDGFPLFSLFDILQETADAAAAVFQPDFGDFKTAVRSRFPDAYSHEDLLLLHRLEISPFARGQRLGLAVIDRAIRDWSSGCSLAVLKPFPLQFEWVDQNAETLANSYSDQFWTSEKESHRRLQTYYQKLGFKRIGRSEFYALCPKDAQPSAKVLRLPDSIQVPRHILEKCERFS